ncbi:hypothetical protein Q0N61_11335 [Corynebacterium sanguinis]|nr:hypothetical protein [Corynebacterium sanguinis]MDN8623350.1 hypothetical protein [Corynebacterium sanguinis]
MQFPSSMQNSDAIAVHAHERGQGLGTEALFKIVDELFSLLLS